jgi:hypothetical protein
MIIHTDKKSGQTLVLLGLASILTICSPLLQARDFYEWKRM